MTREKIARFFTDYAGCRFVLRYNDPVLRKGRKQTFELSAFDDKENEEDCIMGEFDGDQHDELAEALLGEFAHLISETYTYENLSTLSGETKVCPTTQSDLYAFWAYDQFPYCLHGLVETFKDDLVYVRSYRGWFKPIGLLEGKTAKSFIAMLTSLSSDRACELSRVNDAYQEKLEKIFPENFSKPWNKRKT